MSQIEDVIAQNTYQKAKLRFAHAETLLPFIALLVTMATNFLKLTYFLKGLFKDSEMLHWNSSRSVLDNRLWRDSQLSPFAGNVAFVLYNCTGNFYIFFYFYFFSNFSKIH